jgi:hypothetical protein
MRACVAGLFLTMAVLVPKTGNAQVYRFRTPPPAITAAAADWQVNSAPILVDSLLYHPARGVRSFDGQVMVEVGVVDRVPVYADSTLEPYSVVYVPIGRDRLREYERRRDGELAGPTPTPVATSGALELNAVSAVRRAGPADRGLTRRTLIETVPRPTGANGVSLEYNGARYYLDGPAASFSPDRFEPVGDYRGFPVYREKRAANDAIWVAVVKDLPLAPYVRR